MITALSRILLLANPSVGMPPAQRLKHFGPIRRWREKRHIRHFLSDNAYASSYGVFANFEEARRWLPPSREFDEPALQAEYERVRRHRLYSYDYPVLFWLSNAFSRGAASVYDLGGSVGVHYHAYRKVLRYPEHLRWQICEVPAVCSIGREIARREDTPGLQFTESLDAARIDADIWLSCGALQYIEGGRPGRLLEKAARRPGHIILNKMPLYRGEDFVTAQNLGAGSFAPYYVYNDADLIDEIEQAGYTLVDRWDVPERQLYLPDQPTRFIKKFSGLYFRRREDA